MNDGIVGIGIDLTQHVPLVSVAVCPEAMRADSAVDAASLARHWPLAAQGGTSWVFPPSVAKRRAAVDAGLTIARR